MDFKVIILDFDGVILESEGIKDWAFEQLYRDYPELLERIMSYHKAHACVVRFEKFKYIAEQIFKQEYTPQKERELCEKFSDLVFQKVKVCPFVEGAKEFLDFYYSRLSLYIASVNPQEDLETIIAARGLKKYFRKVYASPWLKRDAIKEILNSENLSAHQAIFIGDGYDDYLAAQERHVTFIGRQSSKSFKGAEIPIFNNLTDIKTYLEKRRRAG